MESPDTKLQPVVEFLQEPRANEENRRVARITRAALHLPIEAVKTRMKNPLLSNPERLIEVGC